MRDLGAEIAAGNQVLLFLNRRGYRPGPDLPRLRLGGCLSPLRRPSDPAPARCAALWCHHCGWFQATPGACPDCAGDDLRGLGLGTERLEEELRACLPRGANLARIDRDSTRRKGELERLLAASRRGEIQILLGTQMLAKGHDFPGVTLVGHPRPGSVALSRPTSAPRSAPPSSSSRSPGAPGGRSARGGWCFRPGTPDHPLLTALLRGGYEAFAQGALAERRAAVLPPFAFQALLRAEGREPEAASELLARAAGLARGIGVEGVALWGPVPAPMERRAGRYRAQLLTQAATRGVLQRFLAAWIVGLRGLKVPAGARWSLDVDPQEML